MEGRGVASTHNLNAVLENLSDGLIAQVDLVSRCLTVGHCDSQQRLHGSDPIRLKAVAQLREAIIDFKAGIPGLAQSDEGLDLDVSGPMSEENLAVNLRDNESSEGPTSMVECMPEEDIPWIRMVSGNSFNQDMQVFSYQSKFLGPEDETTAESPHRLFMSCEHFVLNPNWLGWRYWDYLVIALVTFDSMFLPVQLAFNEKQQQNLFEFTYLWTVTAFFGTDMLMQFLTAFEDPVPGGCGLVVDRREIASKYLRGMFLVDLLSTTPWWCIANLVFVDEGLSPRFRFVQLIRCFRVMRIFRFAKLMRAFRHLQRGFTSLNMVRGVNLMKILFLFFCMCHWNACVWWIVGKPKSWLVGMLVSRDTMDWFEVQPHWTTMLRSDGTGDSWRWVDRTPQDVYIFCCYWTLGVMRTMPSEVTPLNHVERIYLIGFMFFAFSAFAISVASVVTIFKDCTDRQRIFDEDMAALKMHMKRYNVCESLQKSCFQFILHLFQNRRLGRAEESRLLDKLPPPLLVRIKITQVLPHLRKIRRLSGVHDNDLLPFVEAVEFRDFVHGEVICRKGFAAAAAWVLVTGRLGGEVRPPSRCLRASDCNILCTQVIDEHCLDEHGVVPKSLRTVDAAVCCQLLRVDRAKFLAGNQAHNRYKLSVFSRSQSTLLEGNYADEAVDGYSPLVDGHI